MLLKRMILMYLLIHFVPLNPSHSVFRFFPFCLLSQLLSVSAPPFSPREYVIEGAAAGSPYIRKP
jgi:hypothetical protein